MISLRDYRFCRFAAPLLTACFATCFTGITGSLSAQNAAVTLPYEADFETDTGYTLGPFLSDAQWNLEPELSAEVLSAGAMGTQSLGLTGGQWFWLNALGLSNGEVTWVDFYLKPVFAEIEDLPEGIESEQTAITGFVQVDTEGEVYAVDGDGFGSGQWLASGERSVLDGERSQDWVRLTYRLDYTNQQWDLFVDGVMALSDLGFLDNTPVQLTEFALRTDDTTVSNFDYFYAGGENPLYADSSNDGLSDAWLTAQGLSIFSNQRDGDADLDGLDNLTEFKLSTRADLADTDGDGIHDGAEYAAGYDPSVADSYLLGALPWSEGFESYGLGGLATQGTWIVTGDVEVQDQIVYSGGQALSLSPGAQLEQFVNGSGESVLWVDIYLRPKAQSAAPSLETDAASAVYFDDVGSVRAIDGSGLWKLLDVARSDEWRRVTTKLNYSTQSYDLYIDGARVAAGFDFARNQPFFSRLVLSAEQLTEVDQLAIAATEPAALDNDHDGWDNATELVESTDPELFDTDQDGLADSLEAVWALDPLQADSGLAQLVETEAGSGVFEWSARFSSEEGYVAAALDGQQDWSASGDVAVAAEQLELTDSITEDTSFERLAGVGETRRVWISFQAKFIAGNLPDVSTLLDPAVALIAVPESDEIAVWDADEQVWASYPTAADLTEWNHYALHFDYVDQLWLLTQNGVLVARELPFTDEDLIVFSRFKALQGAVPEADAQSERSVALFDDFTFSNTEPAGLDFDADGLINSLERQAGSDLFAADSDGDGIDDLWEYQNGLDLLNEDTHLDADGDGLSNLAEFSIGSNPQSDDSDSDGFSDLDELYAGTDLSDAADAPDAIGMGDWTIANVGHVSGARAYTVDGRYVIHGVGSGVGSHDRHALFYQDFYGDFSIAIRVHSADSGVIGVQARHSLIGSAAMHWGYAQATSAYRVYNRSEDFGGLSQVAYLQGNHFPDTYLKLERKGTRFSVYRSTDGVEWISIGGAALAASDSMLAGIAFASGSNEVSAGAEVEVISVVLDQDSDGISDSDEAVYGTLADNADSDGDGVSDYDEIFVIFSDPLVADFDGTATVVASVHGANYSAALGDWYKAGDLTYSHSLRGYVDYSLTTSEAGSFRLDITGGQNNAHSAEQYFDLNLYIDGQFIAKDYIEAAYPDSGSIAFYLPYLTAGEHSIRIEWLNGQPGSSLKLEQIDLLQLGGADVDGNGVVDWLDNHVQSVSDFDTSVAYTSVSPYTLEGNASHPGFVDISSSYSVDPQNPESIVAEQGLIGQYFAHIALDPLADTELSIDEQNGLLNFDKTVIWTPTNLLASSDQILRAGDSLLLAAYSEAFNTVEPVLITVKDAQGAEVASYSMSAADAVPHLFDQAGDYSIESILTPAVGDPLTSTRSIQVVSVSFGTAPRVVLGNSRDWTVAGLPAEVVIEADTHLNLAEIAAVDGDRRFSLSSNSTGDATVLARLGQDGPIIGRTSVHSLVDYEYTEPHWLIVDTFDDGTELWSASLNLGGDIPDDLSVKIRIFKAGVTFLDGTVERTITQADLDELGVYRYYMLRPTESLGSTCHTTTIFQNGEQIALAY